MFATPSDVLRPREGQLAETPLPLLLYAILAEERTCALELRVRTVEKRIVCEEGSPVGCSSNLLHETLGKYLVAKGKITEEQYQKALLESVQTGAKMGEVLVKHGLFSPFDLYKQLQANLAHKILECFRWSEGSWRLVSDAPQSEVPVRMNTLQLILTGASNFLPFEVVATHLAFDDAQKFALVPRPLHPARDLKLSPKETRILQTAKTRPTFAELQQRSQLETEELMRRLYALCVLGLVDFADAVQESATAERPPEPAPAEPSIPAGIAFADEDPQMMNALASAFLEHRNRDPFALLGVDERTPPAALRKAFLGLADQLSPVRFRGAESKEKAEALLVAFARAYATLSDPEQLALWKKRRAAAEEKKTSARPSTEEQFRISTQLLDASSQFAEGKRRLEANNPKGAFEYFQYAFDIEPKPLHQAHLAWARYLLNPAAHARLALQELGEAGRQDASCDLAFFFAGEIHRAQGAYDAAEEAYRRAYKANPGRRHYADLAHEMIRERKK